MQDNSPTTSQSCSSAAGGGGESVASRLKKMMTNVQQQVQNGSGSPGQQQSCAAAASSDQPGKSCQNGSSSNAKNGGSFETPGGVNDDSLPMATDQQQRSQPLELTQNDRDIVRMMGQHLKNLGMIETVETLIRESSVCLENQNAARFRHDVLSGSWDHVLRDLQTLAPFLDHPDHLATMKFLILEQKYLECLEKGRVVEALKVLREELTPLNYNVDRVHALSTYLMFNNSADLKRLAEWEGSTLKARTTLMEKLQVFLPPSVMLPPRRLEALMMQALEHQKFTCTLHNSTDKIAYGSQSLLADHYCKMSNFPCETHQFLSDHCDEVLYCQFSHSGRFLATGSRDNRILVWKVEKPQAGCKRKLTKAACLEGHSSGGAAFFSWSPDDLHLLAVSPEEGSELWLWDMEKYELKSRITHAPEEFWTAVAWYPDGKRFVVGGQKGQFHLYDLTGSEIESWDGVRVRSLLCRKDNKTILASDTQNRIRAYSFEDNSDSLLIKEEYPIISFTLSRDEKFLLCYLAGQSVHMWDLSSKSLAKRFRGSRQTEFTVFSCFGGVDDQFIAAGSEDNNVYLWNRDHEEPVLILKGHNSVVNAVSWNPTDPSMLASCSDDGVVRIWGPPLPANVSPPREEMD